eukprot:CAMPEP_0115470694 /NCGR_PEP_ID=MMETSP0271-20121206/52139_1 /TAXON_ID=71861 /ORGANISM="Scrippsiella trochoidea, Strain CCMP3099" /LENGTH=473 /DNA_ID=CAMNT_0002897855 /DNA_START=23 /DNA_END=1445 /DNA_ORIENTATION=-
MAAERFRLTIPAGQRLSHRLPWRSGSSSSSSSSGKQAMLRDLTKGNCISDASTGTQPMEAAAVEETAEAAVSRGGEHIAEKLGAAAGSKILFLTGGMPGVQETFAKHCGDGSRVWNLVPIGHQSGYGSGTDIHAGTDLEARKAIFGLVGDAYITVEGGPGVSAEAKVAHERGVAVLPLRRTGGASDGMFDFPQKALQKPHFASEEQWSLLASQDAQVGESAEAVSCILAACVAEAACAAEVASLAEPTMVEEAHVGSGGGGRLGSLEWSVIVLDERLIDLEVVLHFRATDPGGNLECEWIQERASGRKFCGSFDASESPRMSKAEPELPEAVVFEFDNSYSWFTEKELELIVVLHDEEEELASRPPPPLPAPRPTSPPRRRDRHDEASLQAPELPKLGHLSGASNGLSTAPLDTSCGAKLEVVALAAQLDTWLARAEAEQPTSSEDVMEVLVRISELRNMCKQKLPELPLAAS